MKNALKNLIRRYLWLHFKLRQAWPVWYYLLNRKGRVLYRKHPPRLDAFQQRIVRDLRTTGLAVTHLDELFPGENLLPVLQRYIQSIEASAKTKGSKPFLQYFWDAVPTLDSQNPFVRIALHARTVNIAHAYLGMFGRLYYLTLNRTVPVPAGSGAMGSQRWHRDYDDRRLCKLFIYLNDVDEASGPFTYIPTSIRGLRWGHLFPQRPPLGSYPREEELARVINLGEARVNTGRAGTVIFCDTSGLHRGGYATQKERIMFTAAYRSNSAFSGSRLRWREMNEEWWDKIQQDPALRYASQLQSPHRAFKLFKRFYPETDEY